MKALFLALLLSVPACASPPPPEAAGAKPEPIKVMNDRQEVVAVIDPATGKTSYQNGGDADQVIAALLKHVAMLNNYHQSFKAEIVSMLPAVKEKLEKKAKAPKAK
jgi:hypothetical protein